LKVSLEVYRKKEEKWTHEKEMLLKTITLLQQEVNKYKAINNNLLKKSKHKRASSEEQTFIFNQTNISSYYPIVVVKNNNWVHKASLRSHLDSVRAILFHQGHLLTAGEDCTLKVWEKEQLKSTIREHLGPVYAMAQTQDLVFTAGAEGVVRKWSTAELLADLSPHFEGDFHEEPIWELAANEKRSLLLTSSADQSHKLLRWSAEGMEEVWTNRLSMDTPTSIDWIGDTRFVSGFVNR
jgi:WD40 repeat protein